jgi:hypothetical protein
LKSIADEKNNFDNDVIPKETTKEPKLLTHKRDALVDDNSKKKKEDPLRGQRSAQLKSNIIETRPTVSKMNINGDDVEINYSIVKLSLSDIYVITSSVVPEVLNWDPSNTYPILERVHNLTNNNLKEESIEILNLQRALKRNDLESATIQDKLTSTAEIILACKKILLFVINKT